MIRALTLWQPWASAILAGVKGWENRPWAPVQLRDRPARPLWLGLHAGLATDRGLELEADCSPEGWRHGPPSGWDILEALWPDCPGRRPGDYPRGLLGLVRYDLAVEYERLAECYGDAWASGPWCWKVGQVIALPEPIPCKGAQGFWVVPPELAAELLELRQREGG